MAAREDRWVMHGRKGFVSQVCANPYSGR
jgi:hypothetical protein